MFDNIEENVTKFNPFELENTLNKNPFILSKEDEEELKENANFINNSFKIND